MVIGIVVFVGGFKTGIIGTAQAYGWSYVLAWISVSLNIATFAIGMKLSEEIRFQEMNTKHKGLFLISEI